ncbi:MAG: RHS repeat protein [Gammaproteobacteria bacterium]|nr:MAG: RHS repeat protein [Gammaproteobacteria bacterium]
MLSISSRDGRTQTLSYDANGRLSTQSPMTPGVHSASPTMAPAASVQ